MATEFGCCVVVWVCEARQEFCNAAWSNRPDEHFIVARNCLHCGPVVRWNRFLTSGTYFPNVADINYIVYRNLPQSSGSGHGLGPRCTPGQAQGPYRPTIGARLGPAWTGPEARASGPRAWPSTTLARSIHPFAHFQCP